MPPARACDRCHRIKSGCHYSDGQDACDRCYRLNHKCESNREDGKVGRPRSRRKPSVSQKPIVSHTPSLEKPAQPDTQILEALKDFEPSDVRLVRDLVQNQQYDQRFVNSFAIESFYSNTMEDLIIRQLLSAPAQVKDALLALAGALAANEQGSSSTAMDSTDAMVNMDRCCRAMERLRLIDSASEEDAKATLFVASSLVSFNDLTIGYGFLPVVRAALLAVKPWYSDLLNTDSSHLDPHLIPVVFAEVMECIKLRQVPTLRWPASAAQLIDRSYGIAHGVLPFLYDICVLSSDMESDRLDIASVQQSCLQLTQKLNDWNPELYLRAAENRGLHLSKVQRFKITKHAECYKILAFSLLSQLRQMATGDPSDTSRYADQLQEVVSSFFTEDTHQVLYLLFPYFVACTELEDKTDQDRVLDQMKYLSGGIATQSCNRMYEFLQYVWQIRLLDPSKTWLELVDEGPNFSIGP